jgi:hypothetical protein
LVTKAENVVVVELAHIVYEVLGTVVLAGSVGVLMALAIVPPLAAALALQSTPAFIATALATAVTAAILYAALPRVRQFLSLVAPFGVVAPLLFLVSPQIRPLLAPQPMAVSGVVVQRPAPIVLIIFDGFRLVELLDEHGDVDATRFPNFARLARTSTWYRNATSVAAFTHHAVPAILTGRYQAGRARASVEQQPENLFTLLGGAFDLQVHEPVTALCPENLCPLEEQSVPRWLQLCADAAVIWLHIELPSGYRKRLPELTGKWSGFGEVHAGRKRQIFEQALVSDDRSDAFLRSLNRLEAGGKMPLYVHHTLLPHNPFEYLPSGERYRLSAERLRTTAAGYDWSDDPRAVRFEEAQYVLQIAHIDSLLGRLFGRLEQLGLFDSSLIVVTADHGFAFMAGRSQRHYSPDTVGDIVPVPLFVKSPGQRSGDVSDKEAETIDILPTIAEIVGVALPWAVDGHPLSSDFERSDKSFFEEKVVHFSSMATERDRALERKLQKVGSGGSPYDVLYDEVARSPTVLDAIGAQPAPFVVDLKAPAADGEDRGLFVTGNLIGRQPPRAEDRVLIAIDGRLAGAAPFFASPESQYYAFEVLLDERSATRASAADAEVLLWDGETRTVRRPSAIVHLPSDLATTAGPQTFLWKNVWSASERAFTCSPRVRELFAANYAKEPKAPPHAPYVLLDRAVRDCFERSRPDGGSNANSEDCKCGRFGDAPPTSGTSARAGVATLGSGEEDDPAAFWRFAWAESELESTCSDDVKERFKRLYAMLQTTGSEVVMAPYEILKTAVATCYIASRSEACACGPFTTVDVASGPLPEGEDARSAEIHSRELAMHAAHVRRNGLM